MSFILETKAVLCSGLDVIEV